MGNDLDNFEVTKESVSIERSQNKFFELFSIRGRYGRGRFWAVYVAVIALSLIAGLLGWLAIPYLLVLSWVSFSAMAKRFHDRGKSAWWTLISFIPFVGSIWILVDCGILAGQAGDNKYGPSVI